MLSFAFEALLEERLLALARQDLWVNEVSQSPEEHLDILDWIQEKRKQKGQDQKCNKEYFVLLFQLCHFNPVDGCSMDSL